MSETPEQPEERPPEPFVPELNYQAVSDRMSGLRQATWIMLLVVASLTILAGLCSGGSIGFAFAMMRRMGPSMSRTYPPWFWVVATAYLVVPTAWGAAE